MNGLQRFVVIRNYILLASMLGGDDFGVLAILESC